MTISEYPRLSGGTFFTLMLQALRQRMKTREHYKDECDGLRDPEVLIGLLTVINPDYAAPYNPKETLQTKAKDVYKRQLLFHLYDDVTHQICGHSAGRYNKGFRFSICRLRFFVW